ncbi:MAG: 3-dehydroquinate synthase [Candidatus Neomarinimicrobiota bacterium]|nr:3-dehydroquinate synthase [Candidatus Neomarinimicrobiota bacterium]
MQTVDVKLGNRGYPIHINPGLLHEIPSILAQVNNGRKWVIISEPKLLDLYGNILRLELEEAGFDCAVITLQDGEESKSLSAYGSLIDRMIELECERTSAILALGGGVVGDVAGFVAATFLRGIDYYQVPTTFLSMVDSAIGGKTGVNRPAGKNLVGAVYQPKAVLIDPDLLQSLPSKEVYSGLGEVIKYGAIRDKHFFLNISTWLDSLDIFPFADAIAKCCAIKARIVSEDEREDGLRRILNFGHTVGHSLEAQFGYGAIRHGEAVAYGMKCAGKISNEMGFLTSEEFALLSDTVGKLPLTTLPEVDETLLMQFLKVDKKWENNRLHFVLLEKLGKAITSTAVTEDLIRDSLKVLR